MFSDILKNYIEETSASISAATLESESQMADINSFTANNQVAPDTYEQVDLGTIQNNAFLANSPSSMDYLSAIQGNQIIEYTVQSGDLLSFIASDYGVSVNSIIWSNNLTSANNIKPGQVLKIPPISGLIHKVKKGDTVPTIAKKYSADAAKILAFNNLSAEDKLDVGLELVVPNGRLTTSAGSTIAYGPGETVTAKKFSYLPDLGGYFMIPTTGRNWGIIHGRNGVDIANSCGTPIYAAADGNVTVADGTGYNGGFGKFIKISHSNGTETLYGHATKLLVSVGNLVSRGQLIALMGTTGRSTGCHLHFEVHGAKNPLAK